MNPALKFRYKNKLMHKDISDSWRPTYILNILVSIDNDSKSNVNKDVQYKIKSN
jgi:hypothetical protein